jgi:transcriptional regulator with XRE-family HTH domain
MLQLIQKKLKCFFKDSLKHISFFRIFMGHIHQQLKLRRAALGLRQQDMEMRIGMPRQQYQRLESGGNPRLDTLELVAKGLNMQLMLIPKDKLGVVQDYLAGRVQLVDIQGASMSDQDNPVAADPWQGLLEEDDD